LKAVVDYFFALAAHPNAKRAFNSIAMAPAMSMIRDISLVALAVQIVTAASDTTPAVVVDDASLSAPFAPGWERLSAASSLRCETYGWKHAWFVHSPKASGVRSALQFTVDIPKNGCYLVEEFHPTGCNQNVSKKVELTVDYCYGQKYKTIVDQSVGGNRWNPVALLPMYDPKYNISMKPLDDGIAIADAFRYTYIAADCPQAPASLEEYARLAKHVPSTVVDDRLAGKTGTASSHTCSSGLINGAHTVDEGEGSAEYHFEPESTGCYRLDEFHPLKTESCPLASRSQLNIDYCLGLKNTTHVDLASNGGQWNTVSHFMFYAGIKGKVTARRLSSVATGSLWAADAFRFTKVGGCCKGWARTARATVHITGVDFVGDELATGFSSHSKLRLSMLNTISSSLGFSADDISLNFRRGSVIVDVQLIGHSTSVNAAANKLRKALSDTKSSMAETLCKAAGAAATANCAAELTHLSAVQNSRNGWKDEPIVSETTTKAPTAKSETTETSQPAAAAASKNKDSTASKKPENDELVIGGQQQSEETGDTDMTVPVVLGVMMSLVCAGAVALVAINKRYRGKHNASSSNSDCENPDAVKIVSDASVKEEKSGETISETASTATPSDSGAADGIGDDVSVGTAQVAVVDADAATKIEV